ILLRVNSSSVSHCGRFANSRLDLRRSARLILCIGGVLLLAGSPGWVSATPKATPPFPYFHTCWLYLPGHPRNASKRLQVPERESAGEKIPQLSGLIDGPQGRSKSPAAEGLLPRWAEGGGMKGVELYGQVRRAVYVEGMSRREAARRFGIDPRTVAKMLAFSVPPGYRRSRPPARPKLDPFDGIMEEDKGQPAKQQHTSKRIFERLRDEHGYTGGITIVKDYVHERRQRQREMFVPLRHEPGHAQVDFGEALAVIGGVEQKIHFFAMDLPHSDACLVQAYPSESSEAFCEGHNVGFEFFGGVPGSILYDNLKLAVARILGDGRRLRTRVFSELQSHYLFADRFGRPGKGNDKGKVEGLVGYARRNFMVPIPHAASFSE